MKIKIPYGETAVETQKPEHADVLIPSDLKALHNPRSEIRNSIRNPIGTPRLADICRGKESIVIVINDITRPSPSDLFVEEILDELATIQIRDEQVTLVVATGNHRPNTDEELRKMVGDHVFSRVKIINHHSEDENNLVDLGVTKRGLPIVVNRMVAEASVRILTGIITPHQSAGYSGGRKSIMPGVAGIKALMKHHSFPIRSYDPILGQMHNNSFHDEALEAAQRVGVDFIINVVKNSKKEIVSVVAGDLVLAHQEGVRICDESWKITVKHLYDIVITSPGGYPKDFDLHQAQKAVTAAEMVVQKDGVIILVAECRDGVGKFAKWLTDANDPQEVIDAFIKFGFTPDHSSKAFMFARALKKSHIIIVGSHIESELLESMFFKTAQSVEEALEMAYQIRGTAASVLFIPYAIDCIPELES
ncbi:MULTISPECIES: nickel-dependent lactate racemase [unclassified Paenibacillus]|uniref:nickel-dependent lactate racemase n=1 Tax=unclassified Paenibacillus TaxID=185978 RepID=UPI001AE436D4|nr:MULTISPECIES: nickel-dependent lactate racemase [unclassified Paenibacillus]MBP1155005.1 nickel-dependent lactate racemase [Paenibacillus sp. PvP091]MBP1169612.1 nickel-dependent lactate racemase [Paenibacillus sp. PvR098]MBP2440640.1 nickel-dependent lactate racemase [Paenibacillus sp. PvP052]